MAADRTPNMMPANTNAEVDAAFDDAVRTLDKAEAEGVIRSERDMLTTAAGLMDDTARRTRPPFLPQ